MFSNKGLQQQNQKQSGGYHIGTTTTPSKSSRSTTKRRSPSRPGPNHPLQNQAELHKIMALFQ